MCIFVPLTVPENCNTTVKAEGWLCFGLCIVSQSTHHLVRYLNVNWIYVLPILSWIPKYPEDSRLGELFDSLGLRLRLMTSFVHSHASMWVAAPCGGISHRSHPRADSWSSLTAGSSVSWIIQWRAVILNLRLTMTYGGWRCKSDGAACQQKDTKD